MLVYLRTMRTEVEQRLKAELVFLLSLFVVTFSGLFQILKELTKFILFTKALIERCIFYKSFNFF